MGDKELPIKAGIPPLLLVIAVATAQSLPKQVKQESPAGVNIKGTRSLTTDAPTSHPARTSVAPGKRIAVSNERIGATKLRQEDTPIAPTKTLDQNTKQSSEESNDHPASDSSDLKWKSSESLPLDHSTDSASSDKTDNTDTGEQPAKANSQEHPDPLAQPASAVEQSTMVVKQKYTAELSADKALEE
jgi:hypothetical protein